MITENYCSSRSVILIVDDNAINLKVLEKLLGQLGQIVITAVNGFEAVKLYMIHKPDLIFMDINMPEMDGFEASAVIRKFECSGSRRIPIIAWTSLEIDSCQDRFTEAGIDGFLPKPAKLVDILNVLNNVLSDEGRHEGPPEMRVS